VRGKQVSLFSSRIWSLPNALLIVTACLLAASGTRAAPAAEVMAPSSPSTRTAGRPIDPRNQAWNASGVSSRRPPTRVAMNRDPVIIMEDGHEDSMVEELGSAACENCQTRVPPWHGNVAGPGACGPACDPCGSPSWHYRSYRPACFPRLSALMSEGYLPSPIPPCEPRCRHCGEMIEMGF